MIVFSRLTVFCLCLSEIYHSLVCICILKTNKIDEIWKKTFSILIDHLFITCEPDTPGGPIQCYMLDESICHFRGVGSVLFFDGKPFWQTM